MKFFKYSILPFFLMSALQSSVYASEWKSLKYPVPGLVLGYHHTGHIWLMKGDKYKVIPEKGYNPSWDSAGERFLIVGSRQDKTDYTDLFIYDKEGNLLEKIKRKHIVSQAVWIPQEDKILYIAVPDNPRVLGLSRFSYMYMYIYNMETKETKLFYKPENVERGMSIMSPRISPDGKHISFSLSSQEIKFKIGYILDRGGNVVYTNKEDMGISPMDWFPDSKCFFYHSAKFLGEGHIPRYSNTLIKVNFETGEKISMPDMALDWYLDTKITPDGKYYYGSTPLNYEHAVFIPLTGDKKGKIFLLADGVYSVDWFYNHDNINWTGLKEIERKKAMNIIFPNYSVITETIKRNKLEQKNRKREYPPTEGSQKKTKRFPPAQKGYLKDGKLVLTDEIFP